MYLSNGSGQLVILTGNVGKDPYVPTSRNQDSNACAFFSLALDDSYKDRDGNKVEQTTWVDCKAFRKTAEAIAQYVKKGRKLQVVGKLTTRTKQLVDPQDAQQKNYTFLEVEVLEWTFMDKAPEGQQAGQNQHGQGRGYQQQPHQNQHNHGGHQPSQGHQHGTRGHHQPPPPQGRRY